MLQKRNRCVFLFVVFTLPACYLSFPSFLFLSLYIPLSLWLFFYCVKILSMRRSGMNCWARIANQVGTIMKFAVA